MRMILPFVRFYVFRVNKVVYTINYYRTTTCNATRYLIHIHISRPRHTHTKTVEHSHTHTLPYCGRILHYRVDGYRHSMRRTTMRTRSCITVCTLTHSETKQRKRNRWIVEWIAWTLSQQTADIYWKYSANRWCAWASCAHQYRQPGANVVTNADVSIRMVCTIRQRTCKLPEYPYSALCNAVAGWYVEYASVSRDINILFTHIGRNT